jgi:hypothetical protein
MGSRLHGAPRLKWLGLKPGAPRTGVAYVAVRVLVYVLALALIVAIYSVRAGGWLIALPIGLITAGGTWYLLGDTPAEPRRRVWLAAGVGLVIAELTWAIGYWSVAPFVGGAALWLGFYVLSGVVEQSAAGVLERRVVLEYVSVAAIGALIVVALARPWSA